VQIVGEGPLARAVERKLELFPDIHAEISGRVGSCSLLDEPFDALDGADRVVIACSELNEELLAQLLPVCRLRGVKLTVVPPTRGMFGTATHLTHVADLPLLDYNTWYVSSSTLALKRVFDVVVGTLALLIALPIFAFVALAILLDDGRPVFFRQLRAGQGGRTFRILKFRTMVRDAEARFHEVAALEELADPLFKLKADPRVTRVGRFLRKTSLDELPQLVNVLKGEMSIVGPRPERPEFLEQLKDTVPFWTRRHLVKPGITGWAQVLGRDEIPWEERFRLDAWYVDNWSLWLDARIVLMTFTQLGRPEPAPVEDTLNIERAKRSGE
jgi:exopolysaccharide biosynthesis polyprenyl glycosylphosphotransferase